MLRFKKVLKSKIFWLCFLLIAILIFVLLWLFMPSKEKQTHIEENYELEVLISEQAELTIDFTEEYDCLNSKKEESCSGKTITITNLKIGDNFKDVINGDSLNSMMLEDAIILFLKDALANEEFNEVTINSDYELTDQFKEILEEEFPDLKIEFSYEEKENLVTYYTITFDTDGGSPIDSVVLKDGEILSEPTKPTKDGYTFKGWYQDDELYDFTMPVTKDFTLTASWEKNSTKEENSSNNNSSNNSSNNNNQTQISKINLNNNISVTEYNVSSGGMDCFFYMFVENLQEVFPNANIKKSSAGFNYVNFFAESGRSEEEVSPEEISRFLSNGTLKINTTNETSFKNIMNKYKNGNYKGIANVTITEDNHRFSFSYDYLSFNGLNIASDGEQANKEITNALAKSTKFMGTCGDFDNYNNKILDEELCSKYNLDCGRW